MNPGFRLSVFSNMYIFKGFLMHFTSLDRISRRTSASCEQAATKATGRIQKVDPTIWDPILLRGTLKEPD